MFYPRPEFPALNLWTGPDGAVIALAEGQTQVSFALVQQGALDSDATGSLFKRESIAGITFEDLLRNLVSAKTLAIATK